MHCGKSVDYFDMPVDEKIATVIESAVVRENATAMGHRLIASASPSETIFSENRKIFLEKDGLFGFVAVCNRGAKLTCRAGSS